MGRMEGDHNKRVNKNYAVGIGYCRLNHGLDQGLDMKHTIIENKHFAALFFALFVGFFIVFAVNKFTMNLIMSMVCLQFSIAFKTWDIIREVQNG